MTGLRSITCSACGGMVIAATDSRWARCVCGNGVECEGVQGVEPVIVTYEDVTRRLWHALHTYAVGQSNRWSADFAQVWFGKWLDAIPNFGCSCQENFRDLIDELPPMFDSADAFFQWSVHAHNCVNTKLGKPLISVEDATVLYGRGAH